MTNLFTEKILRGKLSILTLDIKIFFSANAAQDDKNQQSPNCPCMISPRDSPFTRSFGSATNSYQAKTDNN